MLSTRICTPLKIRLKLEKYLLSQVLQQRVAFTWANQLQSCSSPERFVF